ncbi:hypothetical protein [Arenivirga flava]|uniref:Uncharacterized protein n=1 Tax=Arenivirga flava TaxID=1930060 RepID=A0AA37UHD5_9MICO|nr:hypothetical protein [Arenivirga flava]GMA28909.1 hypothetical protein GCM10025874_21620 [Arenivirga flava]
MNEPTAPIRSSSITRIALAVGAVALLGASLTGCTIVDEVLHGERPASYDSASEVPDELGLDWAPSDATDIDVIESTRADDTATVLLTSPSELPDDCVLVPRTSGPTMTLSDDERELPETYKATEVQLCGDWAVLPTADGWYGWTPVTEKASDAVVEQ